MSVYTAFIYIFLLLLVPFLGQITKDLKSIYYALWIIIFLILALIPIFMIGILKSENRYLDYKLIIKYLCLVWWIFAYLMIPVGIWAAYLALLAFISLSPVIKAIIVSDQNIIVNFIQAIATWSIFIYFVYTAIRLSFSYMSILESDNLEWSTRKYVKESLEITKWKVFYIFSLWLPFVMISMIFDAVFSRFDSVDSTIIFILWKTLNFLLFWWLSYMIFVSVYKIIKPAKPILVIKDMQDTALMQKPSVWKEPAPKRVLKKQETEKKPIAKKLAKAKPKKATK